MYVSTEKMLKDAMRGGYAIGAFNFENMEMALAIVKAAKDARAPVILQTTPSTVRYASAAVFAAMGLAAAGSVDVPVALHLDHGDSFELCREAAYAGYSSIMIDGSALKFEDNVELTLRVVEFCKKTGVPVEAELGRVGGKEDSLVSAGCAYTDPDEACEFVSRTGVKSLAVGIGTAHGIYKGTPVLDTGRLTQIRNRLEERGLLLPLVLHGASGLSDEAVKECVSRGICKVNFATELRQAFTRAIRGTLDADPEVYDPKKLGKPAMNAVYETVLSRIEILGSAGAADGR